MERLSIVDLADTGTHSPAPVVTKSWAMFFSWVSSMSPPNSGEPSRAPSAVPGTLLDLGADDLTRRMDLVEPALVEIKVDVSAIKEDVKAVRDVVAPRPPPQD